MRVENLSWCVHEGRHNNHQVKTGRVLLWKKNLSWALVTEETSCQLKLVLWEMVRIIVLAADPFWCRRYQPGSDLQITAAGWGARSRPHHRTTKPQEPERNQSVSTHQDTEKLFPQYRSTGHSTRDYTFPWSKHENWGSIPRRAGTFEENDSTLGFDWCFSVRDSQHCWGGRCRRQESCPGSRSCEGLCPNDLSPSRSNPGGKRRTLGTIWSETHHTGPGGPSLDLHTVGGW